ILKYNNPIEFMHKYKQPPEIYRKIIKTKDIRIDYKKVFQQENNSDNSIDNNDNNIGNGDNSNEKDVDNINNNNDNNVDNTNNNTNNNTNTNINNINNKNRISIKSKDKIPPKYLSAIKYIPLSIFKLIENLPHPWEDKKVNIIYHIDGMTTIITDKNKIDKEEYKSKWIDFYNSYNREYKDNSYNEECNEECKDNIQTKDKNNINTKYNPNTKDNIN
ncbi:Pre-mRNA splicing factor, partial [Spraguea lophii 42_110]